MSYDNAKFDLHHKYCLKLNATIGICVFFSKAENAYRNGQYFSLIIKFSAIKFSIHYFLTHLSLVSFLWDIGKQCRPRTWLLIRDSTVCLQNVLLKFE